MVIEVCLERKTDDGIEVINTYFRNETTTELTIENTAQHLNEGIRKSRIFGRVSAERIWIAFATNSLFGAEN